MAQETIRMALIGAIRLQNTTIESLKLIWYTVIQIWEVCSYWPPGHWGWMGSSHNKVWWCKERSAFWSYVKGIDERWKVRHGPLYVQSGH